MTINFPARRLGTHFRGTPKVQAPDAARPTLSRRTLFKAGASTAAAAAAVGYGINRTSTRGGVRTIGASAPTRLVKELTVVGTDGWVSMPPSAGGGGTAWPDTFANAPAHKVYDRNVYIFGFAVGGNFETPNRLRWADYWNGAPGTDPTVEAVGGLSALKNRANLSAPILYFHEGDDVRITLWNGGMADRPDIVDAHTIHWHGFPNQIPYFDGVPNGSLSVPIGSNLVYRYLPYRGMAGSYMWHCHVSDAEHVQMGLQGIVFIRAYQNYGTQYGQELTPGVQPGIPLTRAGAIDLIAAGRLDPSALPAGFWTNSPMGYAFNDGVAFTAFQAGTQYYPKGSTAYDREFAFILDEIDPRIHSDDSHFQDQDFTQFTPRFGIMNGRAWPDTILGNWDVSITEHDIDPGTTRVNQFDNSGIKGKPFVYNVATKDQNKAGVDGTPALLTGRLTSTTADPRLGSQPWSSLIQANAGETILLRFSDLGYAEHSMELAGLPFRVIGMDAKNLLQGRDGYEENPNPDLAGYSPLAAKRDDISALTYRTSINVAESRELLVQIPMDAFNKDGTPVIFEFFDRNDLFSKNVADGGPPVGGMRTQLHVFPPVTFNGGTYSLPPQQYPQQVFNPKTSTGRAYS
jgi:hypothetical protein